MKTKADWVAFFAASGMPQEQAELAAVDLCDPEGKPPPEQMPEKVKAKKPVTKNPKKAIAIRWQFENGTTLDQPADQFFEQRTRQAVKLSELPDDPRLRAVGKHELEKIAEEQVTALRFTKGRKPESGSPIRKLVAKILKANPSIKNPAIWAEVSKKPPKGWTAYDNHAGKYIEGKTVNETMGYGRFCTVCGEERKKISR